MGADQFLLTWNNHRSNFAEVFSQLRVQEQLVDVTLLCDGGSYPAHRLVLAACSPYFHQLFTRLPTQHPLVYLRDVRQSELEALLEFIYRGEVHSNLLLMEVFQPFYFQVCVANSELSGLIKIAESLKIKGLGDVSQREPTSQLQRAEKRPSMSSLSFQSARKKKLRTPFDSESKCSEKNQVPLLSGNTPGDFESEKGKNVNEISAHNGIESAHLLDSKQIHMDNPTKNITHTSSAPNVHDIKDIDYGLAHNKVSENLSKRTSENSSSFVMEKEDKMTDIKEENGDVDENCHDTDNVSRENVPFLSHMYDPADFISAYRQLLNLQQNASRDDQAKNFTSAFSPLSVQELTHSAAPVKEPKSLTCHLCGATIKHIANFRRHMKQHLNPRRFPCPWCSAAFGRKDNLKTHTRKHHPVEVEKQESAIVQTQTMPLEPENVSNGLDSLKDDDPEDSLVIAEEELEEDEDEDEDDDELCNPTQD